jgi:hypothetical protein
MLPSNVCRASWLQMRGSSMAGSTTHSRRLACSAPLAHPIPPRRGGCSAARHGAAPPTTPALGRQRKERRGRVGEGAGQCREQAPPGRRIRPGGGADAQPHAPPPSRLQPTRLPARGHATKPAASLLTPCQPSCSLKHEPSCCPSRRQPAGSCRSSSSHRWCRAPGALRRSSVAPTSSHLSQEGVVPRVHAARKHGLLPHKHTRLVARLVKLVCQEELGGGGEGAGGRTVVEVLCVWFVGVEGWG